MYKKSEGVGSLSYLQSLDLCVKDFDLVGTARFVGVAASRGGQVVMVVGVPRHLVQAVPVACC